MPRPSLFFCVVLFVAVTGLFAPIKFSNQDAALKFNHPDSKLILDAPLADVSGKIVLKDNSVDTVSGDNIAFTQGVLEVGQYSAVLTCTFDVSGSDTIMLNGDCRLDARYGSVLSPIVVSGTENFLSGSPVLTQPLVLTDAQTELNLALNNKLNRDVQLNGGKITLDSNLNFDVDTKIVGNGVIDAGGNNLVGLSGTWDGNLEFRNGVQLELDGGGLTLDHASWTFTGDGKTSCIEGGGNILQLANTATLVVGPGHTLILVNVFLKGLDSDVGNRFIIDPTAEIKISRTSVGLQHPYTLAQGTLTVYGDISKVVSAGYDFTFADSALLKVDGTTLWFDTLDQANVSPIKFTNELTQKVYLNGGIIKSTKGEDGTNGIDGASPAGDKILDTSFPTLTGNFDITESSRLIAKNSSGSVRNIVLDGHGYTLRLPSGSGKYFILEPYMHLTLKNVFLRGFNPDTIDWGTSSKITFDDGTVLELPKEVTVDHSFTVRGNVSIDGRGTRLTLAHNDALLVEPAARLIIRNATVMGAANGLHGRLRVTRSTIDAGTIVLQDSGLALDADYTFSVGSLEALSDAKIFGRDKKFTFTSTGSVLIDADSTLSLDHSITFSYAPTIPAWDIAPYKNSKERIVFADPSATLHLNGCTLHSTHTGLRLMTGRVLIEDAVKFVSVAGIDEGIYEHGAPQEGEELEIGQSADIRVLAASTLELDGQVKYSHNL